MKRSKKYLKTLKKIDRSKLYAPREAIKILKENASANFDETLEAHIRLGVDTRQADQQVRGTVVLPHGTGKTVKVAVFASGEKAEEAKSAGADIVGDKDLVEKVEKGFLDFDISIATPDMMSSVGKLGKILGPKGLMPNPKAGTVTFDVGKAVKDVKAGKVEYRCDKFGIIHFSFGRISFSEKNLLGNYTTLLEEIVRTKSAAAKGKYIKSIIVTTTMSPGIKVDPTRTRELVEEAV